MTRDRAGPMSYEEACAVLGPEIVAEIESRPPVPLSPELIARIAPILRAVLDTPERGTTSDGGAQPPHGPR